MAKIETDLLNDLQTVSLQDLHNARLNPFAVELLVEAYRRLVVDTGSVHDLNFAWYGVHINIKPFDPENRVKPIDVMLFCPKCGELHIDKATPEICETCGHMEHMHDLTVSSLCCSQPGCDCSAFKAWLNPPHKSHRCSNCNFVWRPADVPTNGVAHAKTKGENDTMKLVGDIRRAARSS